MLQQMIYSLSGHPFYLNQPQLIYKIYILQTCATAVYGSVTNVQVL